MPSCDALALGRDDRAELGVERDQPDRVLLVDHQVAERRGEADAVVELRERLVGGAEGRPVDLHLGLPRLRRAVPVHRLRQVHDEVARHVGLGLELLDEVLAGLGVDVPVEVLRSSPGLYLRCSENSTEKPWNGLACSPVRNPCDDELGPQVEPRDLADHFRAEVLFGAGHARALYRRISLVRPRCVGCHNAARGGLAMTRARRLRRSRTCSPPSRLPSGAARRPTHGAGVAARHPIRAAGDSGRGRRRRPRRPRRASGSKQIGLAMHNYESAMGGLPAGIVGPEGQLGLSWRVAILPYLEGDDAQRSTSSSSSRSRGTASTTRS